MRREKIFTGKYRSDDKMCCSETYYAFCILSHNQSLLKINIFMVLIGNAKIQPKGLYFYNCYTYHKENFFLATELGLFCKLYVEEPFEL